MTNGDLSKAYEVEYIMEYKKWCELIPYIEFPSHWQIQITPPFGGAIVRFKIKVGAADVSVYLDCYGMLGSWGSPYWEVYPHKDDVFRCDMSDTKGLLKAITDSISDQQSRSKKTTVNLSESFNKIIEEIEVIKKIMDENCHI